MFSRTACFIAASVFAAMGPAAAQVRPQGAPAAQGAAAPSAQGSPSQAAPIQARPIQSSPSQPNALSSAPGQDRPTPNRSR
jgi:hypothetical protein